jgi:hypothetical protein
MLNNFLLQELSQILVEIGDKFTSLEKIEKKEFHEPHTQKPYLEAFFYHPCQFAEETKEPWTIFDGEKTMEPKNEESLAILCSDSFVQKPNLRRYIGYDKGGHAS